MHATCNGKISREISAAILSDTAATMTDAFFADTISAQVGQAVYDKFSAAIPSDAEAARAAAIPAQLYDVVRDCISVTMSGDVDLASC